MKYLNEVVQLVCKTTRANYFPHIDWKTRLTRGHLTWRLLIPPPSLQVISLGVYWETSHPCPQTRLVTEIASGPHLYYAKINVACPLVRDHSTFLVNLACL